MSSMADVRDLQARFARCEEDLRGYQNALARVGIELEYLPTGQTSGGWQARVYGEVGQMAPTLTEALIEGLQRWKRRSISLLTLQQAAEQTGIPLPSLRSAVTRYRTIEGIGPPWQTTLEAIRDAILAKRFSPLESEQVLKRIEERFQQQE
jgi:hypothetical protein